MGEDEPILHSPNRRELMAKLETNPELTLFFEELEEILRTNPALALTVKFVARRVIPDSLDEGILETEARVQQKMTELVRIGLLRAENDKTYYFGDYLPTYAVAVL